MVDASVLAACESRLGTTLRGKWTLERLVGIGGMAAVYVGLHKIGRRDAIKLLHPTVARSKEIAMRFEQEAHAVNKFHHPGAVEIRDVDVSDDGCPFLVMELLDGEDLAKRAHRLGGLPVDELLRYVDEVLDVLVAAHAQGIVHRDIKLDNIFVTTDGLVKILDFGIARMRSGSTLTMAGARLGTTSYMAPEQVRGDTVDVRADIFAVGATMFRVLAKRRVHEATSEHELIVKMGSEAAPKLASVTKANADLCLVVDRALEFKPQDRYPSAATMQTDVRALRARQSPPFATARMSVNPSAATAPDRRNAALAPTGIVGAMGSKADETTTAAPPSQGTVRMDASQLAPPGPRGPAGSTMPSQGISDAVAAARASIPVHSAPSASAAGKVGTMPSADVLSAVSDAKAAAAPVVITGMPAAGPVARAIASTAPMVPSNPPAAGASAMHGTSPSAMHLAAEAARAQLLARPQPVVPVVAAPPAPPPAIKPISAPPPRQAPASNMKLFVAVGLVCLLLGSVGFYIFFTVTRDASATSTSTSSSSASAPKAPAPAPKPAPKPTTTPNDAKPQPAVPPVVTTTPPLPTPPPAPSARKAIDPRKPFDAFLE